MLSFYFQYTDKPEQRKSYFWTSTLEGNKTLDFGTAPGKQFACSSDFRFKNCQLRTRIQGNKSLDGLPGEKQETFAREITKSLYQS